jgi:hypothetical protein
MIRRRFPIRQNLYSRAVTFLYGTTHEINAVLKRDYPGTDNDPATLSVDCIGKCVIYVQDGYEADYICMVKRRDRPEMLAALAHECLHHVAHVLRKAGMPLTYESEEAYCYYFQWVYRNCLEAMR